MAEPIDLSAMSFEELTAYMKDIKAQIRARRPENAEKSVHKIQRSIDTIVLAMKNLKTLNRVESGEKLLASLKNWRALLPEAERIAAIKAVKKQAKAEAKQ